MDIEKIAQAAFTALRGYVERELGKRDATIAELLARIEAIPAGKDGSNGAAGRDGLNGKDGTAGRDGAAGKAGDNGADGHHGIDGKSITVDDVEPLLARLVSKAVDALPKARDGVDGREGRDGQSVSIESVAAIVRGEVVNAVAALPKPADGKDGAPGADGKDGAAGKHGERGADGVNGKDGAPGSDGRNGADGASGTHGKDGADAVIDVHDVLDALKRDAEALALLRGARGEDGARGERGEPGITGSNGRDGTDGLAGEDGASITDEQLREVVQQRFSGWALEFERIATDRQRAAIDAVPLPRDGRDGERGRDGLGLDDFEWRVDSPDGGRTLVLELTAGGRTQAATIKTATVLDRGVYDAQKRYEAGDAITYGGHLWIVQKAAPQGKPGESADFRLAVRRGRDAKE